MTINRFRASAGILIGFNIGGTILTWAAHLQKRQIGAAHAIASGTQFTGPLILVALGIVAFIVTFSPRRNLAATGVILLALYGVGFAIGEVSELFQHNVGISAGRWDVVLAGSVIGAVIGITSAATAVVPLKSRRQGTVASVAAPTV